MLVLIGILIGLVLGLTGAGGSVFAVPLLLLLGGLPLSEAVGISLAAVAASTLYGSLSNLRNQSILWIPVGILATTGALTAPLGKWLSTQIPEAWLMLGFSGLSVIIAVRMWINAVRNPAAAKVVRASNMATDARSGRLCRLSPSGQFEWRLGCVAGLAIGGLVTGLLSGLFGVGGGFLIVPLILLLSQVSMAQAVSSSLVIISFISSAGFVSHLLINTHTGVSMTWAHVGWVAGGGLLGMLMGQQLSKHLAGARLQQIFAVSLVLVSIITLVFHHSM